MTLSVVLFLRALLVVALATSLAAGNPIPTTPTTSTTSTTDLAFGNPKPIEDESVFLTESGGVWIRDKDELILSFQISHYGGLEVKLSRALVESDAPEITSGWLKPINLVLSQQLRGIGQPWTLILGIWHRKETPGDVVNFTTESKIIKSLGEKLYFPNELCVSRPTQPKKTMGDRFRQLGSQALEALRLRKKAEKNPGQAAD